MEVTSVSSGASPTTASKGLEKMLDKTAFLRLIAAQLQYQNPLEPIQDTEFITQLAQFSVLEQLYEMMEQQRYATFIQAQGLIGKEAIARQGERTITGVVEAVRLAGDSILVRIGGQEISWTSLEEIRNP
ncbi:flagellar basal-body rod modification protein FlgD [Thermanaeromonas toyohensis ToBE]|uniref:Flagellar basal-body rod modification protein FlgD n=1 Tax=Thermanaeromonas toyohensis ToBE TaxID=698762 RepID=A0A1W1VLT4_9FIRM|nr:flagellar hook capping FlgD N-terminal domain-containing protein [Thermanaeromonas toyohensis]SMB94011.1 flagellar basal-body rod modification protein FlgD [Thermanaeromonas toyohensis ToBE]